MADRPLLHLTNWSSRKLHPPDGLKWTIMAAPRSWEHGDGVIAALVPPVAMVRDAKAGRVSLEAYRAFYERGLELQLAAGGLTPGVLLGRPTLVEGTPLTAVSDGDTLCCACARGAPCHRRWLAPFLVRAGWRVVLDGEEVGVDPDDTCAACSRPLDDRNRVEQASGAYSLCKRCDFIAREEVSGG